MSAAPSIEPETSPFPRMRGVGSDGFVNIDVACRKCGYDLRALSVDAKCPECGTDVIGSLYGEQLLNADPSWLRTLSNGAQLSFVSLLWQPLLLLFTPLLGRDPGHMLTLFQFLAMPFWLTGVWLISRPDPSGRGEFEYGAWRRAWLVVAIATACFELFHVVCIVERWMPRPPLWFVRLNLYAAVAFIGFRFLAKFATRFSSGEWIRLQASMLSYSLPLCYIGMAMFLLLDDGPGLFTISLAVLYLVSQLMHVLLMRSLGDRLRVQTGWRFIG